MNNNDLRLILNSRTALIVVETYDEGRALLMLRGILKREAIPAWRWTVTDGLGPLGFGVELMDKDRHTDPDTLLKHIKQHKPASTFVLCDFHPYLESPKTVRLLKDIALNQQHCKHHVVLVSHALKLPPELSRYAASVNVSMPTDEEIMAIVREEARAWSDKNGRNRIKTDNVTLQKLVNNLKGLPHQDVRRLAHGAIADDGAITDEDLPELTRAKFELMDMEGVLHFEYSTAHLKDVAGLKSLKGWLESRRKIMKEDSSNHKVDIPKGVLLFGVQGGGKSLAAKAIAGVWGLPLLRLDMACLYNKFVGETERNLREALKLADVMSPCVLWMDEIEKGLAQGSSDNGTPQRLLGTLLTWMAERKSRVFMVATSNDISELPPELMRKGRFDEIFFIDLPDSEMRTNIFAIHLAKRDLDKDRFDLPLLAGMTDGFTGAEIEQAIVSATYEAAARDENVSMNQVIAAIRQTQPLSVVMAERITDLREWARDRAVFAN